MVCVIFGFSLLRAFTLPSSQRKTSGWGPKDSPRSKGIATEVGHRPAQSYFQEQNRRRRVWRGIDNHVSHAPFIKWAWLVIHGFGNPRLACVCTFDILILILLFHI